MSQLTPTHQPTSSHYTCPTSGANSIPVAAKQNYVHGKVSQVAVDEA
jgi:hypothetical protein